MAMARIMVVDDESVVRMDIKEMLLDEGYDVVAEAANGEVAIEQALKHLPDLILMDVKMPKMSGLKASSIIYQKTRIPILILTAYSESQLIDEAKAAGIIGYLVKPVAESDLVPGIEMALSQAKRLRKLSSEIIRLEKNLETRKLVERAKGIVMEHHQISEELAYSQMRQFCMNNQVTLEQVSRQIITSNCFFDNLTV